MSEPNTKYPGRHNYTGPEEGIFGLLRHGALAEPSENVMERVDYVRREKPVHKRAHRLHCMCYLGPLDWPLYEERAAIYAKWDAELAAIYAKWAAERAPINAKWDAERAAIYAKWDAELAPINAKLDAELAPIDAKWDAERAAIYAKRDAELAAIYAKILTAIASLVPDHTWNGTELVMPKEQA